VYNNSLILVRKFLLFYASCAPDIGIVVFECEANEGSNEAKEKLNP
jgi:hypothetical protein